MSADELRRKAKQQQSKARFEALASILIGLTLCVFFVRFVFRAHEPPLRMGFGLLSFWCVFFAYQAYKWIWPGQLQPDAPFRTTLEAYRRELEKQRDYVRHVWRRAGLAYCFVGLGLIIVPELIKALRAPRMALRVLPVCVVLAIWLALFIPMRRRRQEKLRQEIEALRAFEGENQS
ncbi:MAG TPA: hypothetical protein VG675_06830 [Bryobacteraceae bacterium]|nr:hypothetical protein [Bryobacteraceae bacterium]